LHLNHRLGRPREKTPNNLALIAANSTDCAVRTCVAFCEALKEGKLPSPRPISRKSGLPDSVVVTGKPARDDFWLPSRKEASSQNCDWLLESTKILHELNSLVPGAAIPAYQQHPSTFLERCKGQHQPIPRCQPPNLIGAMSSVCYNSRLATARSPNFELNFSTIQSITPDVLHLHMAELTAL